MAKNLYYPLINFISIFLKISHNFAIIFNFLFFNSNLRKIIKIKKFSTNFPMSFTITEISAIVLYQISDRVREWAQLLSKRFTIIINIYKNLSIMKITQNVEKKLNIFINIFFIIHLCY